MKDSYFQPRLRPFRIAYSKRIGAPRSRRFSPLRRKFKKVVGHFVYFGRMPTRFFMHTYRSSKDTIYVVSELQSGTRVEFALSEAEAIHAASNRLFAKTWGDNDKLRRAVRRAIGHSGRANPWTRACR